MSDRWAREPLFHFVAIGALLFAIDHALAGGASEGTGDTPEPIVVDRAFVEGLRARHRERTGREPDGREEEALVRDHVREEALYREARAAGLDEGDAIVRRRMVQKLEFLVAGSVQVREPRDEELEAWMREHEDALRVPSRVTIEHVFFARDRRGEAVERDAREALEVLRAARGRDGAAELGDPFVRGSALGPATEPQIAAAFGPAFARAVIELAPGEWQGPIASAYGAHLVRVTRRDEARTPALEEVRAQVAAAWIEARRAERAEQELARLVARHPVERER